MLIWVLSFILGRRQHCLPQTYQHWYGKLQHSEKIHGLFLSLQNAGFQILTKAKAVSLSLQLVLSAGLKLNLREDRPRVPALSANLRDQCCARTQVKEEKNTIPCGEGAKRHTFYSNLHCFWCNVEETEVFCSCPWYIWMRLLHHPVDYRGIASMAWALNVS